MTTPRKTDLLAELTFDVNDDTWRRNAISHGYLVARARLKAAIEADTERYSKKRLGALIQALIDSIQIKYGFDQTNGWKQVVDRQCSQEACVEFGAVQTLDGLADDYDVREYVDGCGTDSSSSYHWFGAKRVRVMIRDSLKVDPLLSSDKIKLSN